MSLSSVKRSIFIVEECPAALQELIDTLSAQSDLQVCGAMSVVSTSTIKQIQALKPEMVLIDADLPSGSGIKLIKLLRSKMPLVKLVAFSMEKKTEVVAKIIRLGVDGFVLKTEESGELIHALRDILSGHLYVSDRVFMGEKSLPNKSVKQPDVSKKVSGKRSSKLQFVF